MDELYTALIDGTKNSAAAARREKENEPPLRPYAGLPPHAGEFTVQSAVPLPRQRVLRYFTPQKVDEIVRRAGVSESGWRLSGFYVNRRPGETSSPEAKKMAEGAFLSYFGPFSLPYIVYRDARDLFGDRFGRQSYVSMRFMDPSYERYGSGVFLSGNPQVTFL